MFHHINILKLIQIQMKSIYLKKNIFIYYIFMFFPIVLWKNVEFNVAYLWHLHNLIEMWLDVHLSLVLYMLLGPPFVLSLSFVFFFFSQFSLCIYFSVGVWLAKASSIFCSFWPVLQTCTRYVSVKRCSIKPYCLVSEILLVTTWATSVLMLWP